MTKKDGDKLRKMQSDLYFMAEQYEGESRTRNDLLKLGGAITLTLKGMKFSMTNLNVSEEYRKYQGSSK